MKGSALRRSRAFRSRRRRKKDPVLDPGWANRHHGVVRHYRTSAAEGRHSEAVLSACGRHRYLLERWWEFGGRSVLWVMLNPSTADGASDDATVRRVRGFSRREGSDGFLAVNLYSWRATSPRDLAAAPEPVGELCDPYLAAAAARCSRVVLAWGSSRPARSDARVADALRALDWPGALECLGETKDGDPLHPLRVRADAPLRPWTGASLYLGRPCSGDRPFSLAGRV